VKIYFCDGCNESVPLVEVQSGQITTIKGKLFCKTCIPPSALAAPLASTAAPSRAGTNPLLVLLVLALVGWTGWRDRELIMGQAEQPIKISGPSPIVELQQQFDALEADLIPLRNESERIARQVTDLAAGQDGLSAGDDALSKQLVILSDDMQRLTRSQVASGQVIEKVQRNTNAQATLELRIEALSEAVAAHQNAIDFGALSMASSSPLSTNAADAMDLPVMPVVDPARLAAVEDIRRLLLDTEPDLRFEGVDQVETGGYRELADDLVALLADEDMFVRLHAMNVLGNFGYEAAIPALFDVLDDGNASIRKTAAETLVRLTGYDPGFEYKGSSGERTRAIRKWRDWYERREA
jgi:hypothetical protein